MSQSSSGFPTLYPCEHPRCKRPSHLRYCPEHADSAQRDTRKQLDMVLVRLDFARARRDDDADSTILPVC